MNESTTDISELFKNIQESAMLLQHIAEDTDISAMLTEDETTLVAGICQLFNENA